MRKADDIFKSIGDELRDSAKRIYVRGMVIEKIILVLSILAGIIVWIDSEEFGLFAVIAGSGVVEYFIGCGVIYLATTARYARGEDIHLLKKIQQNTNNEKIPVLSPCDKMGPAQPETHIVSKRWECWQCRHINPPVAEVCTRCGATRVEEKRIWKGRSYARNVGISMKRMRASARAVGLC